MNLITAFIGNDTPTLLLGVFLLRGSWPLAGLTIGEPPVASSRDCHGQEPLKRF